MKKILPEIAVIGALLLVVSYGFAQSWTRAPVAYVPLVYVAESADGRTILAVGSGAYLSTNSGTSWSFAFNSYSPCAAVSADGCKMIASIITNSGQFIYISTNSGAAWNQAILPNTNWNSCSSSADGRVLAVAAGNLSISKAGNIYTSTNYGVNWRTNNLSKIWRAITSSTDGTRLAAVVSGDYVYLSTNSGSTWQPTGTSGSWRSIASSMDGLHLAATGDTGTAISTNGGSTWRTIGMNGYGIASSADGSQLILVSDGSTINISTNYGLSWSATNISGETFQGASSSADGNELFVGDDDNSGVWMWHAMPTPNLSLTSKSNNATLSWLLPSTNFVVQQSPDLSAGSWVVLTNVPTLNYTNLQNQIVLPSTNGEGFYRLASP